MLQKLRIVEPVVPPPETGDNMNGRLGLSLALAKATASLVWLAALKRHLLAAKRYKLPEHKMLHAPRTCTAT